MENQVEHQISSSVNDGILEIVITGELADGSLEKLTTEVNAIVKSNNIKKLLVDLRLATGRFSYAEVHPSVTKHSSSFRDIDIALVDIPKNTVWQSFHETTAVRAEVSFKWFTEIDAARVWLKSKQKNK